MAHLHQHATKVDEKKLRQSLDWTIKFGLRDESWKLNKYSEFLQEEQSLYIPLWQKMIALLEDLFLLPAKQWVLYFKWFEWRLIYWIFGESLLQALLYEFSESEWSINLSFHHSLHRNSVRLGSQSIYSNNLLYLLVKGDDK